MSNRWASFVDRPWSPEDEDEDEEEDEATVEKKIQEQLASQRQMTVSQINACKRDSDGSDCWVELRTDLNTKLLQLDTKIFASKPHPQRLQSAKAKEASAVAEAAKATSNANAAHLTRRCPAS